MSFILQSLLTMVEGEWVQWDLMLPTHVLQMQMQTQAKTCVSMQAQHKCKELEVRGGASP